MDRLDAMRLFIELADRGSLSTVACNSGIATSTVTLAINQLERSSDLPYWHALRKSAPFTHEGESLPADARRINAGNGTQPCRHRSRKANCRDQSGCLQQTVSGGHIQGVYSTHPAAVPCLVLARRDAPTSTWTFMEGEAASASRSVMGPCQASERSMASVSSPGISRMSAASWNMGCWREGLDTSRRATTLVDFLLRSFEAQLRPAPACVIRSSVQPNYWRSERL